MFIVLTNASEGFEGTKMAINTSIIVSVFEKNIAEEGAKKKMATFVFASDKLSWQVKESVVEVVGRLNS